MLEVSLNVKQLKLLQGREDNMIKIKTDVLKTMLSKAIKVCSFNKMLPLTELMEVSIQNKILSIRTTDNVTNLFLQKELEEDNEDMRVVVDATLLTSLINKTTTEFVELILTETALTVVANGVYNLDLRVDESNEIIKFPEMKNATKEGKEFDFKQLVTKIGICKSAVPDNMDAIELNNYYLKDNVVATNAFKVTSIPNVDVLKSEEMLISKDLGKVLIDMDLGKANYSLEDNVLTITGEGFILTSKVNQDLDKYPLDGIDMMLKEKFNHSLVVDRRKILDLLDRLSLFVAEYENNSINLTFTKDKLNITNAKKTSDEIISYVTAPGEDLTEFNCIINILHMKEQLEALPSKEITIHFGGSDRAIKVVDGDITEIISLMNGE